MNLQKIIDYINNTFKNKSSNKAIKKMHNGSLKTKVKKYKNFIFNKKTNNYANKRKKITIKKLNFKKLNFLGKDITYYYISSIVIIIGLFILYVTFGPTFKVKTINIIKQENITNVTIAYKAVDKYRGESIFKVHKKDILKRLKNYQHNIRDIKTNIVLPNELNIIIDSYKGIYNTNINGKSFILTKNGVLIPSQYSEELTELIIENKFNENEFYDYKKILDTKYITNIEQITKLLKDNIISLKINSISYYITQRELHIKTDKGITIMFDLNGNIYEQIEKIAIFNKEYADINKKSIIYIDLRINNKIFYCDKGEENENEYRCKQNLKSIYSKE